MHIVHNQWGKMFHNSYFLGKGAVPTKSVLILCVFSLSLVPDRELGMQLIMLVMMLSYANMCYQGMMVQVMLIMMVVLVMMMMPS